jgi:hypothetical protein
MTTATLAMRPRKLNPNRGDGRGTRRIGGHNCTPARSRAKTQLYARALPREKVPGARLNGGWATGPPPGGMIVMGPRPNLA